MKVLLPSDYAIVPWKNGGGTTRDILVLPAGADNDSFSLRISLAPISEEGPFSSFPGIDRRITRLSRAGLDLVFDDGQVTLQRLEPFHFDSVRAPRTILPDGPAEVINVMTRRGAWSATVASLHGGTPQTITPTPHAQILLHAVEGTWSASGATGQVTCNPGATIIATGDPAITFTAAPGATAILAIATPAD